MEALRAALERIQGQLAKLEQADESSQRMVEIDLVVMVTQEQLPVPPIVARGT